MKNLFPLFFSIFYLSILSTTLLQASTITWLGGNSTWDNPAQWDSGTVPTYGDDVIIPSGYVYIYSSDYARATSVVVQSTARIYIYNNGSLEISGAVNNNGLHNMGRVYVFGNLYINGITRTSSGITAKAINNENRIYTYSTSQINIKYVDDDAIYNSPSGYFRARGSIWIYEVENRGIYNRDRFYNYGTIDIEETGATGSYAIVNSDDFRNLSGGEININADIYGGFSNAASTSWTRNYGDIFIEEPAVAINNQGTFWNYSGGKVTADNASIGYFNRSSGLIINYGYLYTFYCTEGIYNYGTIENQSSINSFYSSGHNGGVRNFSGGLIENYYSIFISGSGSRDIQNQGQVNNHHGSILFVSKIIDINSSGSLINDGFLVSNLATGNHIIAAGGTLQNNGVIDDNYDSFPTATDNQKVIVSPVGSMTVGVPYPNVLDVVSTSGLTFGNWKVSPTGGVAGTYNQTTNEFTPDPAAVGISTIYIEIEDNASGFVRNFSLEINGGILPFSGGNSNNAMINAGNIPSAESNQIFDEAIAVFPNPTDNDIRLSSKLFDLQATQVEVFNSLGQLVQQQEFSKGDGTQTLSFSNQLTNGIYILKLMQNGQLVGVERVQLQR